MKTLNFDVEPLRQLIFPDSYLKRFNLDRRIEDYLLSHGWEDRESGHIQLTCWYHPNYGCWDIHPVADGRGIRIRDIDTDGVRHTVAVIFPNDWTQQWYHHSYGYWNEGDE